ncbi:uncharacterized protein BDV14DRAFT_199223 [Aspergillus stella-maris]|uniref:uncharacterized protein n=1 Tax=Aspergillus stella-maris TaxID=1810926 RepID=UPI003CCDD5BA
MADAQYPPSYLETDNGSRVVVASTFIIVLTTVLLALRLFARSLTQARRGWDEFLLIPSYLFLVGLIICLYLDVQYGGLGRPTPVVVDEDPQQLVMFLKILYILDWFYVPSNALSRVSVVALYLRIFTQKAYRGACWFVIAFLLGNMTATVIAAQLECFPLAYTWDRNIPGGTCFDQILWYKLSNIPNVVADVLILALPIPTVWNLKASRGKKIGITIVFFMGSIGLFASCMRTGIFFRDARIMATDPTMADEAFSWTAVECGMYFSAACLIGLRPLFAKLPTWVKNRLPYSSDRRSSLPESEAESSRRPLAPGPPDFGARSRHPGRPLYVGLSNEILEASDATPLGRLGITTRALAATDRDSDTTEQTGSLGWVPGSNLDNNTDERQIRVQTRIDIRSGSSAF